MTDATPTIESVAQVLLDLIKKGLGDELSTMDKARFDTAGELLGFILKEVEPFLKDKIDLADLVTSIADIETAFTAGEDAVEKFKLVLAGKTKEVKPAEATEVAPLA